MKHKILVKVLVIFALVVGLTIPNLMIREVTSERIEFRHAAKQSIASSWTGEQAVLGPVLVVPYTERVQHKLWDEEKATSRIVEQVYDKRLLVLPNELDVDVDLSSEQRQRGIYRIPVYKSLIQVHGAFDNRRMLDLAARKGVDVNWQEAFVSVSVSDLRGVGAQPRLNWNGGELGFTSASGIGMRGNGMRALVPGVGVSRSTRFAFDFSLQLRGMESLRFSPVGGDTRVAIRAAWPHPSFIGRYLPVDREVGDEGFSASWQVTSFSSDMARIAAQCEGGKCDELLANTFGVALVQPVDIYQQVERSVKYAVLIITLTFVAFFLVEALRGIQLHPMNYLLVGCALTVFYLLLLSLSEHIDFGWAYLIACLASTALIGSYVGGVLRVRSTGLTLGGALLLLYGMLYIILRAEDTALLIGSVLIFAVLAGVMLSTRGLDWGRLSAKPS